jgi:hypothetical protein
MLCCPFGVASSLAGNKRRGSLRRRPRIAIAQAATNRHQSKPPHAIKITIEIVHFQTFQRSLSSSPLKNGQELRPPGSAID